MGFEALLGNERVKQNLSAAFARNRVSHFYLISGPEGAGKKSLSRLLAAASVCTGAEKPCLSCSHCRKVMANTHPDFITVDDPEHKNVAVKIVRDARADMYVRPNESDYKVYIFPQELRVEGQNALLKVLEEPPAYGVCILLTDRSEQILPTVRSRCTELKLLPLSYDQILPVLQRKKPDLSDSAYRAAFTRSGGYLGQALELLEETGESSHTEAFYKAYVGRDTVGTTELLIKLEKQKRDPFVAILTDWLQLLQAALSCRSGLEDISAQATALSRQVSGARLLQSIQALQTAITYVQANVSVAAVCGWLQWALR